MTSISPIALTTSRKLVLALLCAALWSMLVMLGGSLAARTSHDAEVSTSATSSKLVQADDRDTPPLTQPDPATDSMKRRRLTDDYVSVQRHPTAATSLSAQPTAPSLHALITMHEDCDALSAPSQMIARRSAPVSDFAYDRATPARIPETNHPRSTDS